MIERMTGAMAVVLLAAGPAAWGEVKPAAVFSDGMVLQQGMDVPVWGTAGPGEQVAVTFAGQTKTAKADDKGVWRVALGPLKASAKPAEMKIGNMTLTDVVVGEVWLCSGQSNMAYKLSSDEKVKEELPRSTDGLLRFRGGKSGWQKASPETAGGCSAVAYYFGKELRKHVKTPVGLVIAAVGGTPIELWTPPATNAASRKKFGLAESWGAGERHWHSLIEPLAGYAIRGATWYQGERNAKTGTAWEYRYLLPAMIEAWRAAWDQGDFPFYWVQVPTQAGGEGLDPWSVLRDSMRRAIPATKNGGMAVFYDHGPSLHPTNKGPAGVRLSLLARAKVYGETDLVYSGPLLKEMTVSGGQAVLTFDHVGGGLVSRTGPTLSHFEIAGAEGEYVPAEAKIVGQTVVVRSDKVAQPAGVRYLHGTCPVVETSLFNKEGLPASPFLTDACKSLYKAAAPPTKKKRR